LQFENVKQAIENYLQVLDEKMEHCQDVMSEDEALFNAVYDMFNQCQVLPPFGAQYQNSHDHN
jgi:hypothetical protein